MLFRILAKFLFKLYINSSKNICVTCPSSVKKSLTERNGTDTYPLMDSKRAHVIDPNISLLSDFLRIAFRQFSGHM